MNSRMIAAALLSALVAAPALAQQGPGSSQASPSTASAPEDGRGQGPGWRGGRGGAAMLRMADANGDGVVTRAEYLAAVDARFARMDANHDGVLTLDEMPMRGMRLGGRGQGGRGQGGMTGGDVPPPPPPNGSFPDATGTPPTPAATRAPVTRDQYRAAAMRRFDRFDTNHDGRIDQAELAASAPPLPAGQ